jgi:hypothetical protein
MRMLCLFALLLLSGGVSIAQGRPWSDEIIYFMMTDRFYDGDPSNNLPKAATATYDPKQIFGINQEAILPKGKNLKRLPLLGLRRKLNPDTWGEKACARIDLPPESIGSWVVE